MFYKRNSIYIYRRYKIIYLLCDKLKLNVSGFVSSVFYHQFDMLFKKIYIADVGESQDLLEH